MNNNDEDDEDNEAKNIFIYSPGKLNSSLCYFTNLITFPLSSTYYFYSSFYFSL